MEEDSNIISSNFAKPLVSLNHPYDSNNMLAVTPVGYKGRNTILKQLREAWDEKWSIFGSIFSPVTLPIIRENYTITPQATQFGFCTDVKYLLDIITHNQSNQISILKLQVDGGKEFLKVPLNIVSMKTGCLYSPTPNSVLSNFVIAMGHGPENYHNPKELFSFPSISKIFSLDCHVQISCDFKVAALLVGIQ